MQDDKTVRQQDRSPAEDDRFRSFFEDDLTGDYITGPDGRILLANAAFARMLGFPSPRDAEGENIAGLFIRPGEWRWILGKLRRRERIQELECRRKRKDGASLWVIENVSAQYRPDGEIREIRGYLYDISRRKAAEQVLRRYELLSKNSRDIIFLLRREDGRILEANTAAELAYGYSREELLDRTILDLRASEQHSLAPEQMTLAEEQGILFETFHVRKDGSRFPVEVSSRGATIDGERLLISIIRDITERKKAEEVLRESEERLNAVFQSVSEGITIFDMTGKVILLNEAEARINGYPNREEMKRDLAYFAETYELLSPDGRPVPVEDWPVSKVLRGESVVDWELRGRRRDIGREWYFSYSGEPVRNERGEQILAVVITRDITEKKVAEEALRESEERYRSLFEHLIDGFAYCRMQFDENRRPVDFTFLEANTAFSSLTGLRDVAGKNMTEIVPGIRETNPELFEHYGRVSLTGVPERFELFVHPLSIWLNIAVYSPRREHFVTVFENITERKQSEEALRDSQDRFRMVLENSLDAAYRRNLHTNRYDYLSPVIEKLTGYTAEEFMSLDLETVLGMMHPLDRIGVRQELERGLAHEPSRKLEYRLKTRTGEYRWFSDNFNILGDEHGTPRYLVGTVRDITDRKQSEMALQMSEERFRKLLETAEEGIWIFDPKGIITFTNEALASMLGYSREELIGKSVFDLLHKEQWKLERQIAVRRRADQGARYDLHYTRRDGNELWATVVESRIRDDDGNSIGSIALFTDITERKRAEQAQAFSERRYRLALDSIPDMIMIFDRKMNLQYLNLAMRRQVGFTGTEFKSVSLREVWPEMHGILQPCLAASAETGAMQTADGAMNGTEKGQLVHATCIPVDENGIIREIIAIIHLVT